MPKVEEESKPKKCNLRKLIDAIPTDPKAWEKLKKIYETVSSDDYKKPDKDKILKLITPAIRKYAQYDNNGVDLITDYMAEDKGLIP
jgi:hypothetical protein